MDAEGLENEIVTGHPVPPGYRVIWGTSVQGATNGCAIYGWERHLVDLRTKRWRDRSSAAARVSMTTRAMGTALCAMSA